MDRASFESIQKSLSPERLASYFVDGEDVGAALARYMYNIELCKSLYPLISIFEVTLRNNIDSALSHFVGDCNWPTVLPLFQSEKRMIEDARAKIRRNGKSCSHGQLMAELPLGFWVALMSRKYNTRSFQFSVIKSCLHSCPRSLRASGIIHKNMSDIRYLRNRIAHHERISHLKDLKQRHELILDFIRWIDSNMFIIASKLDTFNSIYSSGFDSYKRFVEGAF